MKKYLNQLLCDIRNAHRPSPTKVDFVEPSSFLEEMEVIENWATGKDIQPSLSQQCGLKLEQFPPSNLLQKDEMEIINDAFHQMLESWHIKAEIPNNMPVDRAYLLLISLLERNIVFFPGGTLHFDFCTGCTVDCELKEYCPCLQYQTNENK